jgi:hypothetical protein
VSWYLRSLTLDATMTTATVLTLAQAVEMAQATLTGGCPVSAPMTGPSTVTGTGNEACPYCGVTIKMFVDRGYRRHFHRCICTQHALHGTIASWVFVIFLHCN